MAGDIEPVEAPASETSPLLGPAAKHIDEPAVGEVESGSEEDVENGHRNGNSNGEAPREGVPAMAKKLHLLLPSVGIGIYLCAVDQLLTVATYAKIGNDLKALNSTSWIATAYFISLTSFQPLYGKLSDIFGRKECLLFAYAVFTIGCLGCGLARNMAELCAARAVAGIGGGGMNSVVSILLTDIVPLRDRGVWQGYLNIIFAAGTSTGAPLGGLLADSVGWRWSFLGQVPICLAAFTSTYLILDMPATAHAHWREKVARIDFLGAFVLVAAVIALLVGLDVGSNLGWAAPQTIVSLSLAPPLFALFVFVEMRVATHPFAPGHVIFDRSLFALFLANFFGVAGQMPPIFFFPLFFQAVQGISATQSGLLLVPAMVAAVSASLGGGLAIRKTGRYYWATVAGFGVLLMSIAPLAVGAAWKSTPLATFGLVLVGVGGGGGITTTLVGLLSGAKAEDTAVVVACSYLFRSLGSSIGISSASAVFQQVLRLELATRLPDGDDARRIEDRVRESLDYIKELPPWLADEVRDSYRFATVGGLAPALVFCVLAFLATFFVREKIITR